MNPRNDPYAAGRTRMLRSAKPSRRRAVLAICGGGNAGHALAVVASQTFDGEIAWLVGSEEKAEILRRGISSKTGLRSSGAICGRADRLGIISSHAADVIPDADAVILAVPAFAHAPILKRIMPFLKDEALLGSLPARGGFEFEALFLASTIAPEKHVQIFGLQTLPWSARVQESGTNVHFGCIKARVLMATLYCRAPSEVATWLSHVLGTEILPTQNFLNMTLGNPGQVIHPGLMYGFFAGWSGRAYPEEAIPRFYADASDTIGSFVEQLSWEIVRIAREVERRSDGVLDLTGVLPIHGWLKAAYPTQTADQTTVATCLRTGPLQVRKAPMRTVAAGSFEPDFEYRYLSEDVPFGLAVTRGVAELAGVPTPCIDSVIRWAELKLGKSYFAGDRLGGRDAKALPLPQNYALTSLGELIEWYAQDQDWERTPRPPGVESAHGSRV
jgi:hypothetical protein